MRHGKGTWTYANGDVYVGDFFEHKMHGNGIYTLKDGMKYSSTWKDGERVGEQDWITNDKTDIKVKLVGKQDWITNDKTDVKVKKVTCNIQ